MSDPGDNVAQAVHHNVRGISEDATLTIGLARQPAIRVKIADAVQVMPVRVIEIGRPAADLFGRPSAHDIVGAIEIGLPGGSRTRVGNNVGRAAPWSEHRLTNALPPLLGLRTVSLCWPMMI